MSNPDRTFEEQLRRRAAALEPDAERVPLLVQEEEMLSATLAFYRTRPDQADEAFIRATERRYKVVHEELNSLLWSWDEFQSVRRLLRTYERRAGNASDEFHLRMLRVQFRRRLELDRHSKERDEIRQRNRSAHSEQQPAQTSELVQASRSERDLTDEAITRIFERAREFVDLMNGTAPFTDFYSMVQDQAQAAWPDISERARVERVRYLLRQAPARMNLQYENGRITRRSQAEDTGGASQ